MYVGGVRSSYEDPSVSDIILLHQSLPIRGVVKFLYFVTLV